MEEKNVHIVAVGYGKEPKINGSVLEGIGEDSVLIMYHDVNVVYAGYVYEVRELVCSKSTRLSLTLPCRYHQIIIFIITFLHYTTNSLFFSKVG